MDSPEMIQRLKRIARLSMLQDEVLTDLARVVTEERNKAPGTVICQQGEVEDTFYAIESGSVLVKATVDDQEVVIAHLSSGDVFGERALAEALPRTATVVAESMTDLLGLHRKDYQWLVQKHPSLERILVGPEVAPLLGRVPLFGNFSQEELTALSEHVGVVFYPSGRRVVEQGEIGATMYVVVEGDLVAYQMDESGRRRPVKALKKGDAFGETSLLVGEPRDATVMTKTRAELCYLNKASFDDFLKARPDVQSKLEARPDVERKWKAKPFPGQNSDEIVEVKDEKHWMVFVLALLRSIWLWGLGGAILVLYILGLGTTETTGGLMVVLTALWLFAALSVVVWHWIDWRNDFYIVTSQRVVHIERVLLRTAATDVVPIEQVQNVAVQRGLWGNLLNYGHVRVTSAGAAGGLLELLFVREPEAFQQSVFEQIRRAKFRAVAAERAELRQVIRQAIGATVLEEEIEEEPPVAKEETHSWFGHLAQSWLGQRLRQIVTESGWSVLLRHPHLPRDEIRTPEQVIWRKHWGILSVKTYRPLLVFLVLAALTGLAAVGRLGEFRPLDLEPSLLGWAALLFGLLLIAATLWLTWQVEDWRNDQYIVTDTHIIDIERTPFLLNEHRRQARLESIENTQAATEGFWRNVFKLGDVTIETAGEGTFTFTQVRNPGQVQAEIERRREAYRERTRRQESQRRQSDMLQWLSVYADVTQEEGRPAAYREAKESPFDERPKGPGRQTEG